MESLEILEDKMQDKFPKLPNETFVEQALEKEKAKVYITDYTSKTNKKLL